MPFRSLSTFALLISPAVSLAQGAPAQGQLDEISARGRALAGYQRAAWTASSQLMANNPDPWKVSRYVAYHADSGWVVAFGRLSAQRDTFYVSYIAIPAAVNGQRVDSLFEFQEFPTPGADTDFLVRAARAIDNAVVKFGVTKRSYTAAAIPAENGEWFVYLAPAPNVANMWPLGDDVRYRISADGERVLQTRRMHKGLVDGGTTVTQFVAESHRTTLRDEPEDSDVFHVLMRQPRKSKFVVTPHHRFLIESNGSIKLVEGKEATVDASR